MVCVLCDVRCGLFVMFSVLCGMYSACYVGWYVQRGVCMPMCCVCVLLMSMCHMSVVCVHIGVLCVSGWRVGVVTAVVCVSFVRCVRGV